MRIPDGYSKPVVGASRVRRRSSTTAVAESAGVQLPMVDSVVLSETAQDVYRARLLALGAPEVREALIDEIGGQLESGQYRVSGREVVPNLVREQMELVRFS